jgi:glutamine amidotransferase
MCRLILASGEFSAEEVLRAAEDMSCGRTADHDGPTNVHPNGWGAVWSDPAAPHGIAFHRDVRPLAESSAESPVGALRTGFLAVHARHATLAKNHGPQFTHPLVREGETPWFFLHNGFLPTVHRNLGLAESRFDSLEYFDYVVPEGARTLDEAETLERLRAIPPGGSSGNAIAVRPGAAHVIHWSTPGTKSPRYFQMYRLTTPGRTVISSEVVPALGPAGSWEPLTPDTVTEIPLPPVTSSYASEGEEVHAHT